MTLVSSRYTLASQLNNGPSPRPAALWCQGFNARHRSSDWLHQAQADLEDRLRILDALYTNALPR
jgi:hypothetical protein